MKNLRCNIDCCANCKNVVSTNSALCCTSDDDLKWFCDRGDVLTNALGTKRQSRVEDSRATVPYALCDYFERKDKV